MTDIGTGQRHGMWPPPRFGSGGRSPPRVVQIPLQG